jgi:hypothetical protein
MRKRLCISQRKLRKWINRPTRRKQSANTLLVFTAHVGRGFKRQSLTSDDNIILGGDLKFNVKARKFGGENAETHPLARWGHKGNHFGGIIYLDTSFICG